MSSDDAIYVQLNKHGKFVAQFGTLSDDNLPDPNKPHILEKKEYVSLHLLVEGCSVAAEATEYGFQFRLPFDLQRLALSWYGSLSTPLVSFYPED